MAIIYKDIVTWLKGWFYTKSEVDDKLTSRNINEDTALPNLEVLASANQHEINLAIDEKIGQGGGSGGVSLACVSDFIVNLDDLDDVELELSACTGKVISEVAKTGTVGLIDNYTIYYNDGSTYVFTVTNGSDASVDIVTSWSSTTSDSKVPSEKLVKNSLDGKQATLVSGTNLKTINNESLLGSGNIYIQGGSNVDVVTSWSSTLSDTKVPSEKLTKNSLDLKFEKIPVTPTSTTDIDTFKDIGFYTFFNDSAVASMSSENKAKFPSGLGDNSFYLLVEKYNNYAKQTLTKYNDSRTWIRIYNNNNSVQSWSDWKEISTVGHSHTTTDITNFPSLSTVATSGSYTDLSNKPSIPSASSSTPNADTTNGAVGTGTTWARADHKHPKSTIYAESSHTHTKSQITDFPTIPSKTSDLTNDGADGTNVFIANNDSRLTDNRNFIVTNVVPSSTDDPKKNLDDYVTNGFYTFFMNTNIQYMEMSNFPNGLGQSSFYLLVEKYNNYAKQTLTKYSDGRTWIRIYNDNNNVQSWSDWQELSVVGHTHDDRYYTESEMDTALNGKQATLQSGVNIKTVNNESLLGSGNITIQGGGGTSVIGTGSFTINNNGHLIVELPNGVDNPYFINSNGHLVYDTSNTYNGE